ncbi:uncharacterized protein JCM10292_007132 [Rhodotorula paludigena]|uniref:uncharacterized protein n=1 Tax=Rhodotorula paludigena TaxID=86838 RepID=UPI00317D730B
MAPILDIRPGALNALALKLKPSDSVQSIRARVARKLALPEDGADISIKYLWCDVFYTLDDDDDFDVFLSRHQHSPEVTLLLSSPLIPTKNPSIASVSSLPPSSAFSSSSIGPGARDPDASSLYSGRSRSLFYGRQEPRDVRQGTSMHLVESSDSPSDRLTVNNNNVAAASVRSGRSARSRRSAKSAGTDTIGGKSKRAAKSVLAPGVPEHKIKFEEFHNQLGVRTFIGSIGPVQNVRMMMKSGHRACYMSRAFAQQHNFIPKDAAPGFYGFSGITNLGTWPIKVGSKTVEQQVMLVENSYFPVILGRSFMERRGVRTDPLDQTSVVFMDTNESVPTDLVVVKDANGVVVPIS